MKRKPFELTLLRRNSKKENVKEVRAAHTSVLKQILDTCVDDLRSPIFGLQCEGKFNSDSVM